MYIYLCIYTSLGDEINKNAKKNQLQLNKGHPNTSYIYEV